jgi:hypothetical protein
MGEQQSDEPKRGRGVSVRAELSWLVIGRRSIVQLSVSSASRCSWNAESPRRRRLGIGSDAGLVPAWVEGVLRGGV